MLSFKNKNEKRSNPKHPDDDDGPCRQTGITAANIVVALWPWVPMCAARSCTSIYHAQHGDAASHHFLGDDQRTVVTHCYGLRETRIERMFSYNFHAERSGALELES